MNQVHLASIQAEYQQLVADIVRKRMDICAELLNLDSQATNDPSSEEWDYAVRAEVFLDPSLIITNAEKETLEHVRYNPAVLQATLFYAILAQSSDEQIASFIACVVASTSDPHCRECLADLKVLLGLFNNSDPSNEYGAAVDVVFSRYQRRGGEPYPESVMSR